MIGRLVEPSISRRSETIEIEKTISVLIPNFNGAEFIIDCLRSVKEQQHRVDEVIIIDNGSTDGSVALATRELPLVKIIQNSENLGFAVAMNMGIRKSNGDLILVLNNDIVLEPGYLGELAAVIWQDSKIGSAVGKLYRTNGQNRNMLLDSTGHIFKRNRLFWDRGTDEEDIRQYDCVEEVFGPCAAAALYKREMLDDVEVFGEYFDEAFFCSREDIDLNWRAQLRGWGCMYTPNAVGHHHRKKTSGRVELKRLVDLHNYKNWYLYMFKNDSPWSFLTCGFDMLLVHIGKTWRNRAVAWDAWMLLFRHGWATWRKRRYIQKTRLVPAKELRKWIVPVDYPGVLRSSWQRLRSFLTAQ